MKKYNVFLSTHPGRVRTVNEDSFVINEITKDIKKSSMNLRGLGMDEPLLCGVFDGMGGEKGGFEASDTAALVASEYYRYLTGSGGEPERSIHDYVKNCTALIKKYLYENKLSRGGTTFVMAYVKNGAARLFSMGDSRIYLSRGGILYRLSRDHTLAEKKFEANIFTREEADRSRESHVLTRFLGMNEESADFRAESYPILTLNSGDRLLLCSDGLYDMCGDAELAALLRERDATIALRDAALKNGGADNITCLMIEPSA